MGLTILKQDITTVKADAIVNSSNPQLIGYSGVDEILHELGGPAFEAECRKKAGILLPGEAVFTRAYNIPAKYVIHTFIPPYEDGTWGEAAILRSCYRASLECADRLGCESVAFPLIAAGSMGFPVPKALQIAVVTISEYLEIYSELSVSLVIYGETTERIAKSMFGDLDAYVQALFEKGKTEDSLSLETLIAKKGESFVEMLYRYMRERGIEKPSMVYNAAGISKQTYSKLVKGDIARPSMQTVVGLAFALRLTYEEAVPFFAAAGIALSNASKYDIIVTYFLKNRRYDIWEFNEQLLKYGFHDLIGA